MTLRPCLDCGEPPALTPCPEHRGYDAGWDRLSRRAGRLQPWCSDCGSTEDLQADHLPSAWERRAQRKPLRLKDIEVVCGECNRARGSSRPESTGGQAPDQHVSPTPQSRCALHTAGADQS
jgi:hypothetical protein